MTHEHYDKLMKWPYNEMISLKKKTRLLNDKLTKTPDDKMLI